MYNYMYYDYTLYTKVLHIQGTQVFLSLQNETGENTKLLHHHFDLRLLATNVSCIKILLHKNNFSIIETVTIETVQSTTKMT